jgi:hypothetical protein
MTARDHARAAAALAPGPVENALVRFAPIRVRTEPGEVASFLRETGGAGTGDFVPLSFPIRWLALPAIRAKILQMTGGEGFLPVHEAQSFVYEKSLRIDTDYVLAVEIETREKPPRLILKMAVSSGEGEMEICTRLETVLRIVRLAAETDT